MSAPVLVAAVDPLVVLPLVLAMVVPVVSVLVVLVVLWVAGSGRDLAVPSKPWAPLTLNARLIHPGDWLSISRQLDSSRYGTLTVTAGELHWRPDVGVGWTVPVGTVTVTAVQGVRPFAATPNVHVTVDGVGPLHLVVSDRPINRFMRNTAKQFRQARAARLLARCLVARGARSAVAGGV